MKDYKKSSKIGRTKLTKNDLSELVALINSGIPVIGIPSQTIKEDVEITAYLSNFNITEYGLDNFLKHNDLPMILDFIVIDRKCWTESIGIDKTVNLILGSGSSELRVTGQDQAWVLGKHTQITEYLKSKRPALWFISKLVTSIITGLILGATITMLLRICKKIANASADLQSALFNKGFAIHNICKSGFPPRLTGDVLVTGN